MPEQTGASKAGGKNKKLGRWKKKPGNNEYKASNRRCKNKIKRVLKAVELLLQICTQRLMA